MKTFRILALALLSAIAVAACSKSETDSPQKKTDEEPTLAMTSPDISVTVEAQTKSFSFKTNSAWTASSTADWAVLSATSGAASDKVQSVDVSIKANTSSAREATISVSVTGITKSFKISQAAYSDGIEKITIKEFKAKGTDSKTWYRMTGIIASIANFEYGNFYIVDDTGYLYVYGLTAKQSETNDQTFSSLGLKVGDAVTFVTHRSKYNDVDEAGGTIPAYYESHTKGSYSGIKAASAPAKWLELPETSASDKYDYVGHYLYDGNNPTTQRSYSYYWDYDNMVALWAAYPLYPDARGSGTRTDAWAYDPLLDADKQPNLSKVSYHNEAGVADTFIRGHVVPSADRLSRRNNIEVFFGTNITPQHEGMNSGIWADMETKIRNWSYACDTLYVVSGSDCKGSTTYRYDNDGKQVTVPVGLFKTLLRYNKSDNSYLGFAIYFKNAANSSSTLSKDTPELMSIDALEEKLGMNFYVNLPEEVQRTVEAENPKDNSWWWDNAN